MIPCQINSCQILSSHILSSQIISCQISPCQIFPCQICPSYALLSYAIMSDLLLSDLLLPYPLPSDHIMSDPLLLDPLPLYLSVRCSPHVRLTVSLAVMEVARSSSPSLLTGPWRGISTWKTTLMRTEDWEWQGPRPSVTKYFGPIYNTVFRGLLRCVVGMQINHMGSSNSKNLYNLNSILDGINLLLTDPPRWRSTNSPNPVNPVKQP